jgi:perosamine synthetase
MTTKPIQYVAPSISQLEIDYVLDAITNGWGRHCYEYIHRFEASFAEFMGTQYAHATSSCTGALHLGLAALGIGNGDEVILADINWIATISPIKHLQAIPVLVDIEPDTWCISPEAILKAITPKTKVVIVTHIYGNIAKLDKIIEICAENNLYLIEDSAEAFGGEYNHRKVGSIGTFGVFSFHGTKTMTTGEGGVFVTSNQHLYEKVVTLNNHGRSAKETRQFWPETVGYKFKMSNIQAALGLAQLNRANELINSKLEIYNQYSIRINSSPILREHITLNPQSDDTYSHAYWMVTAIFKYLKDFNRENLITLLQNNHIDARVFFWPLSSLGLFTLSQKTPNAYYYSQYGINLPTPHGLTTVDIHRICSLLEEFITSQR